MSKAKTKYRNTIDSEEIKRFSALSDSWWDPEGDFRPLHRFNPIRLEYIRKRICTHFGLDSRKLNALEGLTALDIGCGGGLVTEPMVRMGATTSAIDASEKCIGVARHHAALNQLDIDYRVSSAETLAAEKVTFDIILALEIIEHVKDIDLFVLSCRKLINPGGIGIFATLNRTAKSFTFAIVGAEYILRWLPRGTHQWNRFIKPSELAALLGNRGLAITDITGVKYNFLKDNWLLSNDVAVNYMLCAEKAK
ncbi:MAG: bifunctional 2-polyprenyl-6-hydroxyphenol methylase/3-demethylubiquinol 3-O-methyltransferase UbiG [Pseudomonadota bacterium]|nr:bifunctional 2-polyprenyl-6-hydroxyphenol methylase/3-demethylubiquinol 3-O-methyltransferase UbiG [Pseudomonadota bacterium]